MFIGSEQEQTFSVQAGFLSGKPPQGGSLNLNLVLGTASKLLYFWHSYCTPASNDYLHLLGVSDVSASPQVQPSAAEPLQTFEITLRVDGISQEFNETFSIEFTGFNLDDLFLFPTAVPVNNTSLQGTIIDQDGKFYI